MPEHVPATVTNRGSVGGIDGTRHRVTLAGTGQQFEVVEGERILAAARRAGVWLPYECGWGSCSTCKATLVEGETRLLFPQAPAIDARDERRRRILLCQSTAASDIVLKSTSVADAPRPERVTVDHTARLQQVEPLGPDIARFWFELAEPAAYRPGQFAVLDLAPDLRRCYSMAGLPGSTSIAFIAKRYAGRPGSERLFATPAGSQVAIELPYGDMWLRPGDRPLLLIAGGTGVSAILALLAELADRGDPRPVHVCYGATTSADLVCWAELEDLVGRLPHAELHGALIRPDDGWAGAAGTVVDALAPLLPGPADEQAYDVYLAGPPVMTAAVEQALGSHPRDRIHVDSFGSPPAAATG